MLPLKIYLIAKITSDSVILRHDVVITFDDEVYDMVLLGKFHADCWVALSLGGLSPESVLVVRHFGDSLFADLHTRCTEQFCPSLVINRHTRDNAADASEAALEMVQLCTQVRFFVPALDAPLMPLSLNYLRTFLKILDSL